MGKSSNYFWPFSSSQTVKIQGNGNHLRLGRALGQDGMGADM